MASILLPTQTWTAACEEVIAQIDENDELLIICDTPTDTVTDHPRVSNTNVETLVAGEPSGCSGKANALAHGMEHAAHERIIWTDADFSRGNDWLARMKRLSDRYGAVSGVPVFVGDALLWQLYEPISVLFGTLLIYLFDGVWGGSVIFNREQVNANALVRDLRRTLSDDALLWDYLNEVTTCRELTYEVPVETSLRSVWHRLVRFHRIVYLCASTDSSIWPVFAFLFFIGLCVIQPFVAIGMSTIVTASVYRLFGIHRRTYLFAFLSILCLPGLAALGAFKQEFIWGGRRYQWPARFDVRVLSSSTND